MPTDVLAEIAACLESAPNGDIRSDQVKGWLFTEQNCVAVRLDRILKDKDPHDLLTKAAGRTWKQVTKPKSKAQQLWQHMGRELLALAKGTSEALDQKVDSLPKGLLASLWSPKHTYREVASMCWKFCQYPLAIKADLIFPWHVRWKLQPCDQALWRWVKSPHADNDTVGVPPLGDFPAALVINRLAMVKQLLCFLASVANEGRLSLDLRRDLVAQVRAVRTQVWDTGDAPERKGAMALLQVYLAGERCGSGYDAKWSVIP